MAPMRMRVAALACSVDGIGATVERERYLDLLAGSVESPRMRLDMARMSSCALVVRGLWRLLGCTHPILARPYRIGRAMSDVVEIAQAAKAWRTPLAGDTPGVGDAVIVGVNPRLHVYVITSGSTIDGAIWHLESIDGGQGPGGTQIRARQRRMAYEGKVLYDTLADGTWRPVYGWADCVALLGAGE